MEDPALFLAAALQSEMAKAGIRLDGQARLASDFEKPQPGAQEIFAWKSRLLDSICAANQRSHNFCAEQILKTLGAARFGKGSFESGSAAVREFTRAAQLPDEAVTLVDGCGLSPEDRATPQAVSARLEVIYRSKIQEAFFGTLATNGEPETTLKNRLTEPAMRGRIHAKTGTIKANGVSALSGYAEATDGEIYAFSVLVNGFRSGAVGAATGAGGRGVLCAGGSSGKTREVQMNGDYPPAAGKRLRVRLRLRLRGEGTAHELSLPSPATRFRRPGNRPCFGAGRKAIASGRSTTSPPTRRAAIAPP